jgi:hypothetical protein
MIRELRPWAAFAGHRRRGTAPGICVVVLTSFAAPLTAQERGLAAAFAIESIGGAAGSAAGLGIGLLVAWPGACPTDAIDCILERLGVAVLVSVAGAPLGAWGAGRIAHSEPSLAGAVIGSLAGVAAGLGALKLIDEASAGGAEGAPAVIAFSVTHGVVTAIGSRIARAIAGRDRREPRR